MSVAGRLSRYPWRRAVLALGFIVLFGIIRMPLERGMARQLEEQGFRDWSPSISNWEMLTYEGFVGALGGFRSLIASVYDLMAHNARTDDDWEKVEQYRNVTTTLQPRFWRHWDQAAWDMAWNAHSYYRRQAEIHKDDFEGWRIENIIMPRYLEKGIEFAERGMRWLPDSYRLPLAIAQIYSQPYRYNDPCAAIPWYLRAAQVTGAPDYLYRQYAHHLALCEGMEEKAYEVTSALYRSMESPTPTLRIDMERLEDHFARQLAGAKSLEALEQAATVPGANYRDLAALALRLLEVERDPAAAGAVYRRMIDDPGAPFFYRRKMAMALAELPESAPLAHRALRALHETDPDALRPEDYEMITELENRLGTPPGERIVAPR